MADDVSPRTHRDWPERLLRPFAEVRAGEAVTALVLAGTLFLLLTAYYLLKVIREPLILMSGGAEVKAYAAVGQALLLLPVLRMHGAVARRVGRLVLIAAVLLFVATNLLLFAGLLRVEVPIGLAFYLWVGTFNYLLVATFWSFANDIYTPEQGKRLFAIVGVGSSIGALAGAALAAWLLQRLSPFQSACTPAIVRAPTSDRLEAARSLHAQRLPDLHPRTLRGAYESKQFALTNSLVK